MTGKSVPIKKINDLADLFYEKYKKAGVLLRAAAKKSNVGEVKRLRSARQALLWTYWEVKELIKEEA